MGRDSRMAELTDLLTEDEIKALFDAAYLGMDSLRTYALSLTQYSYGRRLDIIRMAKRLKDAHSASMSPSASLSPSASESPSPST